MFFIMNEMNRMNHKSYNNTSICLPYSTLVVIHNDHDSFTTLHSFATLLSLDFPKNIHSKKSKSDNEIKSSVNSLGKVF